MPTIAILTNVVFFSAILLSRVSGNDKLPHAILAIAALSLVPALWILLRKRWGIALLTAIPAAYTATIILLSRQGIIDPLWFLGFR